VAEIISRILPLTVRLSALDADLLGVVSSACGVALMDFCSRCGVWGNNSDEIAQSVSRFQKCTNVLRVAGVYAGSILSVSPRIP
jgi:hypothetical protein